MQRALLEIESEIEANDERVSAMENHMKNVENEVKVVQVGIAISLVPAVCVLT